jgi:hypothetical protein
MSGHQWGMKWIRFECQVNICCITKEKCKVISCNVYFHGTLNDNLQVYVIKRNILVVHVLWAMSLRSSPERQLLETCWSRWNSVFYQKAPVTKASHRLTCNNQLQRSHYTIVRRFWNKFICLCVCGYDKNEGNIKACT